MEERKSEADLQNGSLNEIRESSSSGSSRRKDSGRVVNNANKVSSLQRNNTGQRKRNLLPVSYAPFRVKPHADVYSGQNSVNSFTQRVMSAKLLRVKQLQNQLSETQNQLNELMNENRLLRTLQKRQATALQRFEGSQDQLPQLIRAHGEEIRVLNTKLKQMKEKNGDLESKLKRRDMEFNNLKEHHNHLLKLSQDKQLFDREKLAKKVEMMEIREKENKEKIKLLNRRLELEGKNFRHHLNVESTKLKETQNDLKSALGTINNLKAALETKEKYVNSTLPKKLFKSMDHLLQQTHVSLPIPPRVSIRQPQKVSSQLEGGHNEVETSTDSDVSYSNMFNETKDSDSSGVHRGNIENKASEKTLYWANARESKSNSSEDSKRKPNSLGHIRLTHSDDSLDGLRLNKVDNRKKKRLFTNIGSNGREINSNYIAENSKLQARMRARHTLQPGERLGQMKLRSQSNSRVSSWQETSPSRFRQYKATLVEKKQLSRIDSPDRKGAGDYASDEENITLIDHGRAEEKDSDIKDSDRKDVKENSKDEDLQATLSNNNLNDNIINRFANLSWDEMKKEMPSSRNEVMNILGAANSNLSENIFNSTPLDEEQKVNLLKMLNEIDDEENQTSGNDSKTFINNEAYSQILEHSLKVNEIEETKKKSDIFKELLG